MSHQGNDLHSFNRSAPTPYALIKQLASINVSVVITNTMET